MAYDLEQVREMFKFHPPKDESVSAIISETRQELLQVATWMVTMLPPVHEADMAIDKLREAMMWANSAIACNQKNRG